MTETSKSSYGRHQVFSLSRSHRPVNPETSTYHARTPKVQVGDEIEVLRYDGSKHPELAGRRGTVSYIKANGVIMIDVEESGTFKSTDIWWQRVGLM